MSNRELGLLRQSRSTRNILIGLSLGVATGLFLGEHASVFKYVADAYVRLLQMTVLPYLIVSLIAGFGSLDAAKAGRLFMRVGLLTLVLWGIAAANTVGTFDLEQVGRLRVFLVGYGAFSLLLALWILPGLVACLTPIPARRVLQAMRDALITAFMTGELFVVLAILLDRSKELLEEQGLHESEEGAPADIIIPTFYNFPHVAKLLSLSFVLFAAWYSDTVVPWARQIQLGLAGIVSLFGSMNTAVPFLLDLARVPSDTFQLFLATGILNSRFGTLAAAMHMVVLTLVGSYAMTGRLRVSGTRILRYCAITVLVTALTIAANFTITGSSAVTLVHRKNVGP